MPLLRALRGVRYDPDRVDLARVLVPPDLDEAGRALLVDAEPRCALRLREPSPAGAFWRAELLRAGALLADREPALYVVRQHGLEDDEDVRLGFFAEVVPGRGSELVRVQVASPGPAHCAFVDEKRRVARVLRAATEERDADARVEIGGELIELFVVDDETSCAKVATQLEDAAAWLVEGASSDRPFVAFFAPLGEKLEGRAAYRGVSAPALIARTDRGRFDLLGSAEVFFDVQPLDANELDDVAPEVIADRLGADPEQGAALYLDADGPALLRLRADAPVEALDLGGLEPAAAPVDTLVGAAARALLGEGAARMPFSRASLDERRRTLAPGEAAIFLPSPVLDDGKLRPAGTVALYPPVVDGFVFP